MKMEPIDKVFVAFMVCACATFVALIAFLVYVMVTGDVG